MARVDVRRPLPRWLVALFGATTAVLTLAGMAVAAELVGPIFLALVLAVTVQPLLRRAARAGVPRWLAVTVAVLTIYAFIIGLALALIASVGQLARLLPEYADEWAQVLDDVGAFLAGIGVTQEQVEAALRSVDVQSVIGFLGGLLSSLVGLAGSLVFVLVTVAFMTVDSSSLQARLDAVPGVRPGLGEALAGFARNTRSYLWVTTLFGFVVAVIDAAALWLLGIPLALVWGLLSFITNYIPNVGFLIGLIPPTLLGLLVDGPRLALLVIAVYSVINFMLQSVVQPMFVSDAVGLSVTVTFLSLIVWAWVLGPLGAILAIPLSLLVRAVLLDHDPDNRWALELVSAPGPERPTGSRETEDVAPDIPAQSVRGRAGPGQAPEDRDVERDQQDRPQRGVRDEDEVADHVERHESHPDATGPVLPT
jgi:AI-2 transport protein TqsA